MSKHERQKERGEARAFKVRVPCFWVSSSAGWSQFGQKDANARLDTQTVMKKAPDVQTWQFCMWQHSHSSHRCIFVVHPGC